MDSAWAVVAVGLFVFALNDKTGQTEVYKYNKENKTDEESNEGFDIFHDLIFNLAEVYIFKTHKNVLFFERRLFYVILKKII
jgi:hypothetical protein